MRDILPQKKRDLFRPQIKIFSGIDTIKVFKAGTIPQYKIPKKRKWWLWIFLIFLPLVIFFSTFGVKAVRGKLDFLKLFQQGKYLVIFQNNAEARPTGGFIGSFAIVEFKNFKIQNINFNTNIYKLDKTFIQNRIIAPPEPLEAITGGRWALRDSNYAASFPQAAQKIQWFYQEETGDKVDGVIAVNASLVQDLLKATGPIELAQYNTNITADNFFDELSSKIEIEYFLDKENKQANEPKTILKEMMPEVLKKAWSLPKIEMAKFIYRELEQKQILLYFNDKNIQKAVLGENWGGNIEDSKSDYLYINNANIANGIEGSFVGGKSSLKVQEAINYKVEENGNQLLGNLTLTRSHSGSFQWPDGVNNNWTRIFVPEGSQLEKAELNGKDIKDKIEVGEDSGKTYFGTWITTAPATSNILQISYILPIKNSNYELLVQKQPGNLGDNLNVSFGNKVLFDGVLDTDKEIK